MEWCPKCKKYVSASKYEELGVEGAAIFTRFTCVECGMSLGCSKHMDELKFPDFPNSKKKGTNLLEDLNEEK